MLFFVGLHHVSMAGKRDEKDQPKIRFACISVNVLRGRKGRFVEPADGWMMDSGAFTELFNWGKYRHSVEDYAREAARWVSSKLKVIVAQDYMCEPVMLQKTGLTVAEHQRLTIERYDELRDYWALEQYKARAANDDWPPIMPVLQGWTAADYVAHLEAYGDRLTPGMWVGVGSVCKRQGDVARIIEILSAIKARRPDLRLHGFGVKLTALKSAEIQRLLETADSMAWSFSARKQGRNANSVDEAVAFVDKVERLAA